jgi:alpha-beta hydrolase superfamily lysophospholipase
MGALIALEVIAETPEGFAGAVLSSPAVRLRRPPGRWTMRAARLAVPLFPLFPVSPSIKPDGLSSDPEVAAAAREDKLMLRRVSIRWALEFFAGQATAEGFARRISVPTLVLAGEEDGLVDPESVRDLTTWIPSEHLTSRFFPGARHELHSETAEHRHAVFAVLEKWMGRIR